jgi:hypothetical protein
MCIDSKNESHDIIVLDFIEHYLKNLSISNQNLPSLLL